MKPRRWYGWLLRLFPASFRDTYGAEILAADTAQRRPAGAAALDLVRGAAGAHADILRQDARQAVRAFRRAPGFAVTVVAVMALGIGATTAAYSLVYHVLLGPLPYPQPQALVQIQETTMGPEFGHDTNQLSPIEYRRWSTAGTSLAAIGAWSGAPMDLTGNGEPRRLDGVVVTASLLPLMGIAPAEGRWFTAAEDRAGGPKVVIISDALWHALGAPPQIVGSRVQLSGTAYTVVGVMPPGYAFPNAAVQIWTPFQLDPRDTDPSNAYLTVAGRLRPGASLASAQSELAAEAARLATVYPNALQGITAYVTPLAWQTPPQRRAMLWMLLGGALCVLLIACLNLANLVLTRLLARREEWAMRAALGAGRERLMRQLLTEMLMLAAAGGAVGVGLAALLVPLLGQLTPAGLPMSSTPALSAPVLWLAAALTVASGVGFGVLPSAAWAGGRFPQGSRSAAAMGSQGLRPALVIAEIAGCMALVAMCGMLGRSLQAIASVPYGYQSAQVMTLRTDLPRPKYDREADQQHYFETVLDGVRALPGTQAAGFTSFLPTKWMGGILPVGLPGRSGPASQQPVAFLRLITPGYLEAMGIPLVRGRRFTRADGPQAPKVAIVSADFARQAFPGAGSGAGDALGRQFTFVGATRTVVGVVGAVRMWGPERHSPPQVYLPYGQADMAPIYTPKDLAVRSQMAPAALIAAVRRVVRGTEPEVPISNVAPLAAVTAPLLGPRLQQLDLYASFGVLALVLSGLGIYGLLAFAVASRRGELAVRMALGATPRQVVRAVLKDALRLGAAGVAAGLLIAAAAARVMPALLGSAAGSEAPLLAAAAAVCLAMVLAGALAPAWRAARVDPAAVLRG